MNRPTVEDVRKAGERIKGVALRTPFECSRWLASVTARDVWLKMECFQATGSFKIRGAMAKLSLLAQSESEVLTVSAGNHGLAVAHCAEALDLDATVVVPLSASRAKVEAIRRYRVTLLERGASYDEAERAARALERESGACFVSPYNDLDVIAGQGTVALEMLEEHPDLEAIIAPVGGGGLIAGVALAAKALSPRIKIYGAEPVASPSMREAFRAGRVIEIHEEETVADGLAGNIEPDSITFPIARELVDDIFLVSEPSIRAAIARMAREDHVMIEGSAAVALAALCEAHIEEEKVGVIITGRNISLDLFAKVLSDES